MGPQAWISRDFRRRARHESERYGHDPWVFVRELLQNARDAGARHVLFTSTLQADGSLLLSCRDDGCGMSFEHARRYLFRLYASSKERSAGSAGRFGVGFWSVLANGPRAIVVSSWPRAAEPWELELDGALQHAQRRVPPAAGRGTQVRLVCGEVGPEARQQLAEAVERFGHFLTRLDAPRLALDVCVDGRPVAAPFDLPAPRARFERRGLRGVVGLGPAPRVELFVKGLPVRAGSCLQDLLAPEAETRRAARTELGGGLAPVVLLDSHDVEVQITRDEPRASAALERLVVSAEDELDRLIESQLECLRPEPRFRRLLRGLRAAGARLTLLFGALGAGLALGFLLWSRAAGSTGTSAVAFREPAVVVPHASEMPVALQPYRDLGRLYSGPWGNLVAEAATASVALRYEPGEARPRFATLVVDPLAPAPAPARAQGPYEAPECLQDCLDVELLAAGHDAWLRLPVPTGQRVDPHSVRVEGRPAELRASADDEPLVALAADAVTRVRYRTGPARAARPGARTPRELPAELQAQAEQLALLPEDARPTAAWAWVQSRVRYSTSPETAERHRALAERPFLERALEVGAGDCDIQNGVLAVLLDAAGVPARLVIGYLGRAGAALPWLHGWVEYRDADESWQSLDASVPQSLPRLAHEVPRADETAGDEVPQVAQDAPRNEDPERMRASVAAAPAALRSSGSLAPIWPALALGLGLAGLALFRRERRVRRELKLDPSGGLHELLRGVLQNPQAFDHLPAVLQRPLLPRLEAPALGLGRAWGLAAGARLFASRRHSPLALRAARAGLSVLDVTHAEAHLAAEALGAIDLDEWQKRLARARPGALAAVNAHLRARAEGWRVAVVDGLGAPVLLRLPGVALQPHDRADRLLLVDAGASWLTDEGRPTAQRFFEVLAHLAEQLGLDGSERARLLGDPARAALQEALR